MIIQTVDESMFVAAFDEMNRSDNFSVPARRALFDYFDDLSDDPSEACTLDVIAICCDWSEYTLELALSELSHVIDSDTLDDCEDDDEKLDVIEAALQDYTTVIRVEHYGKPDTLVIACF